MQIRALLPISTPCLFALTTFALAGRYISGLFSISLLASRIIVGILVFVIGYHMLHGRRSPIQESRLATAQQTAGLSADAQGENAPGDGIDDAQLGIAVSPLASPILAGPGTIATTMNFPSGGTPGQIFFTVASFALVCVITYFLFINGQRLVRFIGYEASYWSKTPC